MAFFFLPACAHVGCCPCTLPRLHVPSGTENVALSLPSQSSLRMHGRAHRKNPLPATHETAHSATRLLLYRVSTFSTLASCFGPCWLENFDNGVLLKFVWDLTSAWALAVTCPHPWKHCMTSPWSRGTLVLTPSQMAILCGLQTRLALCMRQFTQMCDLSCAICRSSNNSCTCWPMSGCLQALAAPLPSEWTEHHDRPDQKTPQRCIN